MDDKILFVNRKMEKMFKAAADQLNGLHFGELFMPDDREIMAPNILKVTRNRNEFECETMLYCSDGSSFLGLMHCAFFQWKGGSLIAATIHDITKMKSLERMLKHSEHEAFLGRMLNDISHQIRNPVLVIGGLAKRLAGDEITEKYGEIISKESRRLEILLDTLNAFIQLPRPKLNRVPLADLFRKVEQQVKPLCDDYHVTWKYEFPERILQDKILIDLALLIEAIEAAVKNGCEAYQEGDVDKTVTLQLLETFDQTCPYAIKIIDTGSGIPAEDMDHVASHFFKKKSKHIGMGLTFAQRIIDEQDGEMTVDSVEGEGTTVTFFLKKERRKPIRIKKME
jgi:PAS domain S-box-containing protein